MKKHLLLSIFMSILFISSLTVVAIAESQDSKTVDSIYEWVKAKMEISEDIGHPTIQFVSKQDLQRFFEENNKKSYKTWQEKYGSEKANEMMESYMEELLGLFDPVNANVYIGDFIEDCRQKSVLAHELSHYVQEVSREVISSGYYYVDMEHLFREMQAYAIQEKFEKEFCSEEETS